MYNYDEMIDRLKSILSKNKISVARLSELTDIPYRTLYKIVSKETKEPSVNTMIKIAHALNVSTDTLIYGFQKQNKDEQNSLSDGEIVIIDKYRKLDNYGKNVVDSVLDIEYQRAIDTHPNAISDDVYTNILKIPLADASLSAGTGNLLLTDTYELIEVDGNKYPDADVAFRVKGDSMEPDYYDGDIVYIHKQPAVNVGEIGAFLYDDEQYIKQLIKVDGVYKLHSLNGNYKDIEIKFDLITYGKVIN